MAEFMMVMKGGSPDGDWESYIEGLIQTGMFRGGSSLANGLNISKFETGSDCIVTGFIRFEAQSRDVVEKLVEGNPTYESGNTIEILELIED